MQILSEPLDAPLGNLKDGDAELEATKAIFGFVSVPATYIRAQLRQWPSDLAAVDRQIRHRVTEGLLLTAEQILHMSAEEHNANSKCVRVLRGYIRHRTAGGRTLLMEAALRSWPNVKLLLDCRAETFATDNYGATALHYFTAQMHPQTMLLLLQRGANPNAEAYNGATPLMIAIANEDVVSVQLLLLHGADASRRNRRGKSALDFAAKYASESVNRLFDPARRAADVCRAINGNRPLPDDIDDTTLTSLYKSLTPIMAAIKVGRSQQYLPQLLSREVGINKQAEGWTPLKLAVVHNDAFALELLMKCEDVDEAAGGEPTALQLANAGRNPQIIRIMKTGRAARTLCSAIGTGGWSEKLLRANRAGVNGFHKGRTPLMLAAELQDQAAGEDAIQQLVAAGANVNLASQLGYTALMAAAEFGHPRAVQLLLSNGADCWQVCRNRCAGKATALDLASDSFSRNLLERAQEQSPFAQSIDADSSHSFA